MKTRLRRTDEGLALMIPQEMLDACHIGDEAEVSLEHETLRVSAPGGRPRQGWKETLAKAEAGVTGEEDEQTLAYWNGLPEAPESPEVEPRTANQELLKEEPKHYARPEGQDGE